MELTREEQRTLLSLARAAICQAVLADGSLSSHEAELLRAVSDTLGCPMPPVLAHAA